MLDTKDTHSQEEHAAAPHFHHATDEELKHGDKALALSQERVIVTEADSRRIRIKTDFHVLSILMWVYFLQILDKTVIGFAATFGLQQNAHLHGNQYSTIGAMGYYAQLGAQPVGAFLLVKYPVKITFPAIVVLWGAAQCGLAGSTNFAGLAASRFFLGWFEAACIPLFTLITIAWYRRSEQPMRVAAWYGTSLANVLGAPLCFALSKIRSETLHVYQIIFLITGIVTVLTGFTLPFIIDNSVVTARFLTPEDRAKGVERLRANNTGVSTTEFKWRQVRELLLEPKTYLFIGMSFCINLGASVSSVFGPLLLRGLVGFPADITVLLNAPFGALQTLLILLSCYVAYRFKTKSIMFAIIVIPVIWGSAILYTVPRTKKNQGPLLFGFYSLSFLFAGNPLIISWIGANTAGQSKKTAMMCIFNAASAAGNIVGPYVFTAASAPAYLPGLRVVMAVFCILFGLIFLQVFNLRWLNRRKEAERVRNGKPAKIADVSMDSKYADLDASLGSVAFLDLTDVENDEFTYVY